MEKRRSLTQREQVQTLNKFLEDRGWTQVRFVQFLESKGITITAQYINDVLHGRRNPGPKFVSVFKQITGITLVNGLVESEEK